MDRKQKSRYLLAIYLLLASLAVILVFLAFRRNADTWQSILINLSTELLGVVFVFFLVNYFFLIDDWNLSERIKKFLDRLEQERPSANDFFQKLPNIDALIQNADNIDMCGVTLTSTINRQLSNMRERLRVGAKIRILIVDPNSKALDMSGDRSDTGEASYYRHRLESTFQDIGYLLKTWRREQKQGIIPPNEGSVSVRLIPFAPSFSILAFDVNRPDSKVLVEIYPHKSPDRSPQFTLDRQRDGDWYRFFVEQFENMWKDAKPWDPEADS